MNFGTHKEFRAAVKGRLEAQQYHEAARIIMENPEATSQWWLDWAFEVVSGRTAIVPDNLMKKVPLLKERDLFGEAITTGRRARNPR